MLKILLFLILAFFLVTMLWSAAFSAFYQAALDTYQRKHDRPPSMPPPEPMVACSHCGTYLPASDCIKQSNKTFCSLKHAQQSGLRREA